MSYSRIDAACNKTPVPVKDSQYIEGIVSQLNKIYELSKKTQLSFADLIPVSTPTLTLLEEHASDVESLVEDAQLDIVQIKQMNETELKQLSTFVAEVIAYKICGISLNEILSVEESIRSDLLTYAFPITDLLTSIEDFPINITNAIKAATVFKDHAKIPLALLKSLKAQQLDVVLENPASQETKNIIATKALVYRTKDGTTHIRFQPRTTLPDTPKLTYTLKNAISEEPTKLSFS